MSFPSFSFFSQLAPSDGEMMNRSNSAEPSVPSFMSFVGLQPNNTQKPHLWDWETVSIGTPQLLPTIQNQPHFFDSTSHLPPPMGSFPFHSDTVKRQERGIGGIGLDLGHRTYFPAADAMAVDRLFTRSRGLYSMPHHYQPPRCQAEGCQADLSGAKHYHRRHKVCEFHAKASVVVTGGVHQRFCQQCSRFHVLAEFDDAKRSCRKRLAEHNRRRRKPQITTIGDPTALKNPTTNSTENSSNKSGTCSISESRTRLEEDEGYRMKAAAQLRNGAALSLGGVGDVESWPQSVYQHSHNINQQHLCFSSPSSPSTTYFNNHSLLCSTSNEASQSTRRDSDQHQSILLHLGNSMFEVDFM